MILKLFGKPFPTKRKPSECPTKEKKWRKKRKSSGEERKQKVNNEGAAKLSRKKTIMKFCFLRMPKFRKL